MECKTNSKKGYVILVTGMKLESRLAKMFDSHLRTVVSGVSDVELWEKIQKKIKKGGGAVISYGFAGGLNPNLKSGDIIIGDTVYDRNITFETDIKWRNYLKKKIRGSHAGNVIGVDQPITTLSEKFVLYSETRASIVDMESHIVARIAKVHDLPFAIVRVVIDPANKELPDFVSRSIKESGSINFHGILKSILSDPKQISSLFGLVINFLKALWSLFRCNRLVGKGFGFFDL